MKVVLTASGGGHTGYAVALAQRLYGKAELAFIIPKGDEWTRSKVEKYGEVVETTKMRGPRDSIAKLLARMPRALWESLKAVPGDAAVFVSTGSNHSLPPALVARLKGLKLVNLESSVRFTRPSKTVKLLKPFSHVTVLQWPEQKKLFPDGVVVGPLYEKPEHPIRDEGYVLVTGGTYGHKQLFDAFSKLSIENVVLQTGRVDPEPYIKAHPEWRVFRFDPDFGRWIAGARVVVSHLGKTVIDAALTYHKPVVIVPNPEWRLTAGWEDARILAGKLNAIVVDEITPEALEEAVEEALKRQPPSHPDGAEKLAKMILEELAQGHAS